MDEGLPRSWVSLTLLAIDDRHTFCNSRFSRSAAVPCFNTSRCVCVSSTPLPFASSRTPWFRKLSSGSGMQAASASAGEERRSWSGYCQVESALSAAVASASSFGPSAPVAE